MSAKTVRKIFISVLIFLPLQYIVVGVVGHYANEPWPAFVFPGFKSIYESGGVYQINQTRFELYNSKNEKVVSVKPHHLFYGIPRSQVTTFVRSVFPEKNTTQYFSSEAKMFLHQSSQKITNQHISSINIVEEIYFLDSKITNLEPDSIDQRLIGKIHFTER